MARPGKKYNITVPTARANDKYPQIKKKARIQRGVLENKNIYEPVLPHYELIKQHIDKHVKGHETTYKHGIVTPAYAERVRVRTFNIRIKSTYGIKLVLSGVKGF